MAQVREITPKELQDWQTTGREFQLVDIREAHEVAVSTLGGEHIPMAFCLARQHLIRRDVPVVVHCRSGARAAAVVSALEQKGGFDNLYNLRGGIEGWAREMAPEMEVG